MIAKTQIHTIAQQMLEKYGAKAIAQAGENALTCEQRGEIDAANEWRHVKDAMQIMRGPHQG
jgi:TRAP-type mannitol/chloroaromatic compound transport system substrate-binding protein